MLAYRGLHAWRLGFLALSDQIFNFFFNSKTVINVRNPLGLLMCGSVRLTLYPLDTLMLDLRH
jgi:hypothetical protein